MQADSMKIFETQQHAGCEIAVVEYERLRGAGRPADLYYREKLGLRLRTLRFTLQNSSFIAEPGLLHYLKGPIDMKTEGGGGGVGGLLSRAVQSLATGESMHRTQYQGTGIAYMEPSFQHYLIVDVDDDEIVCDRGAFAAATGSFRFSVKRPDSVVAGALGGEGYFQPCLKGSGLVVLQSPVPAEELTRVELQNERLVVDGNFAIARAGSFRVTVEKSQKSILGTLRGGEGLVTVFQGTGLIWLAPTASIYSSP